VLEVVVLLKDGEQVGKGYGGGGWKGGGSINIGGRENTSSPLEIRVSQKEKWKSWRRKQ